MNHTYPLLSAISHKVLELQTRWHGKQMAPAMPLNTSLGLIHGGLGRLWKWQIVSFTFNMLILAAEAINTG